LQLFRSKARGRHSENLFCPQKVFLELFTSHDTKYILCLDFILFDFPLVGFRVVDFFRFLFSSLIFGFLFGLYVSIKKSKKNNQQQSQKH